MEFQLSWQPVHLPLRPHLHEQWCLTSTAEEGGRKGGTGRGRREGREGGRGRRERGEGGREGREGGERGEGGREGREGGEGG